MIGFADNKKNKKITKGKEKKKKKEAAVQTFHRAIHGAIGPCHGKG